ncbi:MAG: hypothetical protein JWQ38_3541 [Flavipsychrobacter sp.]|nr:hypothetical protein [Flavipsychrobacter sp.]
MKNRKVRYLLVGAWLVVIFCCISYIFWYTDWQYSLPTPVPGNYHAVKRGTYIDLGDKLPIDKTKPVLIHFFNPDCPCSRFNMTHFRSLVRKYGNKINFAIVVMNEKAHYTEKEIQDKYDLAIPISFDTTLAAICGVYSTPQAVLLNTDRYLFYRGNYNKSRYCADKNTNYAQMAIDSLLDHRTLASFDESAFNPYGCQLPTCKK